MCTLEASITLVGGGVFVLPCLIEIWWTLVLGCLWSGDLHAAPSALADCIWASVVIAAYCSSLSLGLSKFHLDGWPSVTFLGLPRACCPGTRNLAIGWSSVLKLKTWSCFVLAKLGIFRFWWWHRSDLISSCLFGYCMLKFSLRILGPLW